MRRMLTAKLQNRSGVLNRFTGVLSRRQVNIESISVGTTENPEVSRITIIIDVTSLAEVEQIIKQLNRLCHNGTKELAFMQECIHVFKVN